MASQIFSDLFGDFHAPVLAAYGAGVDSTAMLIELVERGERIDHVLFANAGAEKARTYAYRDLFAAWLREHGVPFTEVRYEPKNFKNFPPYRTLDQNCFTNATLPSISFGYSSCSQKWKIAPQNAWTEQWEPAQRTWRAGGRVIKLIGYDCSPADQKRYAEREGYTCDRYEYRYPLRELGWKREDCIARIRQAGLPVPAKSACYMCAATKPEELHEFEPYLLRRIVLLEARARPRLRNIDGLWRKPVKGIRGGRARPGSMTEYIRDAGLLPGEEIKEIIETAPMALVAFQADQGERSVSERIELAKWLEWFDGTGLAVGEAA